MRIDVSFARGPRPNVAAMGIAHENAPNIVTPRLNSAAPKSDTDEVVASDFVLRGRRNSAAPFHLEAMV